MQITRRLIHLGLILSLVLLCGCSRARSVTIENQLEEQVHVQLALTYLPYSFNTGQRNFDTFIGPRSIWKTRESSTTTHTGELLRGYSNAPVIRLRKGGKLWWSEYSLGYGTHTEHEGPIHIIISTGKNGVEVNAIDMNDEAFIIEKNDGETLFNILK